MTFDESVPFNSEEVARRYACRPGFRLADYAEVGLPVYRLTVQAYFLSRKQIPPVEEFVLKAIEAGLGSAEEIGGLLGIERLLIDDAMASLVQTDDVYLAAPPGSVSQVLSLTLKGKQTLREAKLVAPEERIISIDFDGLLRRPIPYQGWLQKPRDLKEAGVKEIPPFPQKRPETGDLKVKDVMAILRQSGGTVEFGRDLLGIKAIERRELYFQTALVLVYRAKVGDDVQVAFAVDGRLSSEHEEAFARANGPKKLGIQQSLTASTRAGPKTTSRVSTACRARERARAGSDEASRRRGPVGSGRSPPGWPRRRLRGGQAKDRGGSSGCFRSAQEG